MKSTGKIFTVFILLLIESCSNIKLGPDGKIEGGTIYPECTEPSKRYAENVDAALKGSVAKWGAVSGGDLSTSVRTEVMKLTDYSQQGLDLDLVLFRICEMAVNRSLNPEQTNELITLGMKAWNNKMSINEQKNIIAQLQVELESNLKSANELKLNTQTILKNLNLISGSDILRNPKIKILPLLFPNSNLDSVPKKSVNYLVTEGLTKYQSQGLNSNEMEKQKFSLVGKAIAMTIDKTLPTFNSLADKEGTRYPIYSTIWSANASSLSKIDIFDVTKFQQTYSELNSLKANYNIIVNRAIDYLSDLNSFFKPQNNKITREHIEKILTSERLSYELIRTYSKSLVTNIESLSHLQEVVNEALK